MTKTPANKITAETLYKLMPSYLDGHCAGFNGWPCPELVNQVDQQATDRGYWDGCKRRELLMVSRVGYVS